MVLAGCGGGGSGNSNSNTGLMAVNLIALTNDNRLVNFNSRPPGTSTLITISGLAAGDSLRAIDFRFTPPSNLARGDFNGNTTIYAIGQNDTSQQLYALFFNNIGVSATAVGARFNLIPSGLRATAFGFDFNPTVDRIRVVEPTSNRNFRLNPNTGSIADGDATTAGVQGDGTITYDTRDVNTGKEPDAVAAAYTNPDADSTTGTTLYVLDAANDKLATQGRGVATDANFVSPNAGRLFTVVNLGINLSPDSGFDISPTGNAAFLSNGNRIYSLNLATGALSGGQSVSLSSGVTIIGLAATS